jgi:hypothetical protein
MSSVPISLVVPPPSQDSNKEGKKINESVRERSKSKYKSPPQTNVHSELEFAPYARHVAVATQYILVICGIITLGMTQRMTYLGPGIYCFCVAILLYVWHFIGEFNKVDKSSEGILENRGWPSIICKILTVLNHHAISFIATLLLSGYLFTCTQTALAGGSLIISSFLYLIAVIRREKLRPITGLN